MPSDKSHELFPLFLGALPLSILISKGQIIQVSTRSSVLTWVEYD